MWIMQKKNGQTNQSRKQVANVSFKKKKKKSSLVTLTWGCYCWLLVSFVSKMWMLECETPILAETSLKTGSRDLKLLVQEV